MSFHGFPSIFSCLICKTSYFKPLYCFFHTTPACIFYPRIIHSRLECFFPVWNDPFQTKPLDHGKCSISWQWKEIGKKFFQITFTNIELEFWGWLSYPNSGTNPEGFLPSWKDLFQDGRNHSRMEGILPQWDCIYCMWLLCQPKSFQSWLWDFGLWDFGLGLDNLPMR